MKVIVAPNVTQSLLRYYKALRTNTKYKISLERAWEKYSNFYNYVHGGIVNDLQKGRFCPYFDMGQRFYGNNQPKFPYLKYLTYVDKSNFKWYISYYLDTKNEAIRVVRIKGATNVKCESKRKSKILLKESQLRRMIRETTRRVLLTA